jgi:hypothetical protein
MSNLENAKRALASIENSAAELLSYLNLMESQPPINSTPLVPFFSCIKGSQNTYMKEVSLSKTLYTIETRNVLRLNSINLGFQNINVGPASQREHFSVTNLFAIIAKNKSLERQIIGISIQRDRFHHRLIVDGSVARDFPLSLFNTVSLFTITLTQKRYEENRSNIVLEISIDVEYFEASSMRKTARFTSLLDKNNTDIPNDEVLLRVGASKELFNSFIPPYGWSIGSAGYNGIKI